MPASQLSLPQDDATLALVINRHFDRERIKMLPMITMFRVVWEYLAGARRFDVVNLNTGEVQAQILDREGKLEFQGSDLLRAIDQIVGHLGSYDLSNLVTADGMSLSALKDQAIGQVLSDSTFSSQEVQAAAQEFLFLYASLGSCGITCHVEDNPANSIGMSADIEVIHPMELVPWPSIGLDVTKARGLGREYFVPYKVLEQKFGKAKMASVQDKLYWFEVMTGQDPTGGQGLNHTGSWWTSEGLKGAASGKSINEGNEEVTAYVRLREVWVDGPRGTCSEKATVSGQVVLQKEDYRDVEAYRPIGFARFMENGTFYGAGMYHVMFHTARWTEQLHKSMFNEVTDLERYGYLVVPQGNFNVNNTLREIGKGLKVVPWEPDPMTDGGQRPFIVQPNNTQDRAIKASVYAKNYFDMTNPLTDIIKEKGRIDSASGLAVLQEVVERAVTTPTKGLVKAFGQMYRAGLAKATSILMTTNKPLPVSRMTLDLAGAVIDWETNQVRFPTNPLPSVARLRCAPRMTGSKSTAQRKSEAMELLKLQVASRLPIILQSFQEGWDLPVWLEPEKNAYLAVIQNILTLFGDGVSPGQMVDNMHFAKPELQLPVLDAFMSGPKMKAASVDVVNAFVEYRKFLIEQTGRTLPEGMPSNPDEYAVALAGPQNAMSAMSQQSAM